MNCESCGHAETKVVDSRLVRLFGEARRMRVHRCLACDKKTKTVEIPLSELEGLKQLPAELAEAKANMFTSALSEDDYEHMGLQLEQAEKARVKAENKLRELVKECPDSKKETDRLETEYTLQDLKHYKAESERLYQESQHWKGLVLLNER